MVTPRQVTPEETDLIKRVTDDIDQEIIESFGHRGYVDTRAILTRYFAPLLAERDRLAAEVGAIREALDDDRKARLVARRNRLSRVPTELRS